MFKTVHSNDSCIMSAFYFLHCSQCHSIRNFIDGYTCGCYISMHYLYPFHE